MKIIHAGFKIMRPKGLENPEVVRDIYQQIEESGRLCYKSEGKMTDDSGEAFIRALIRRGHESVLEHASMKVRFTVDRGVSHELVRHRLASFSQESTRYCNYSQDKFGNEITVIEPPVFDELSLELKEQIRHFDVFPTLGLSHTALDCVSAYGAWCDTCLSAERRYFQLLDAGYPPEIARDILPTSLKTEVDMTANMREWRRIFKLRAAGLEGKPHPQMLEVMEPLLRECKKYLPALFEDIPEFSDSKKDES